MEKFPLYSFYLSPIQIIMRMTAVLTEALLNTPDLHHPAFAPVGR
jgi:hypothetical protein